jgi:hypothetical protein
MTGDLKPYQGEDFVTGDDGKTVGYKGPIFRLKYPVDCDDVIEMLVWQRFGYVVLGSDGANLPEGRCNVITVLGDIPEWLQTNLTNAGITVKQTKERGEEIPYPLI